MMVRMRMVFIEWVCFGVYGEDWQLNEFFAHFEHFKSGGCSLKACMEWRSERFIQSKEVLGYLQLTIDLRLFLGSSLIP